MSNWNSIDKHYEEKIIKIGSSKVRLTRPINSKTYSLSCPICNNVIGNVDDMTTMRQENSCNDCYLTYYYQHKEKWSKGWRPKLNNE